MIISTEKKNIYIYFTRKKKYIKNSRWIFLFLRGKNSTQSSREYIWETFWWFQWKWGNFTVLSHLYCLDTSVFIPELWIDYFSFCHWNALCLWIVQKSLIKAMLISIFPTIIICTFMNLLSSKGILKVIWFMSVKSHSFPLGGHYLFVAQFRVLNQDILLHHKYTYKLHFLFLVFFYVGIISGTIH